MNFPIGYGMNQDQPQEVAAHAEPQEATTEPGRSMLKRKRARVTGGRFAADDPATAANEAWAES
jgi:hypothetical protein